MSTITSLFTAPEDILAAQEQQNLLRDAAINQQGAGFGVFQPLYQAGLRGINTASQALFPTQDPRLQRATMIQGVLSKYQNQDMTDPTVMNQMSRDFAGMGLVRESLALAKDARDAKREQQRLDIETEKLQISRDELLARKEASSKFDALGMLTEDKRPVTMNKSTGQFETIDAKTGQVRPFDPTKDKLEYKPSAEDPLKTVLAALFAGYGRGQGEGTGKGGGAKNEAPAKKKPAGPLNPADYMTGP